MDNVKPAILGSYGCPQPVSRLVSADEQIVTDQRFSDMLKEVPAP